MPFKIIHDDITRLHVDAVVNAANKNLRAGSGVCGAIFAGAGMQEMKQACDKIGGCPTGGAVITPGFRLAAKFVIHAVGPIWLGGFHGEEKDLASCYDKSLMLAAKNGVTSIAFPLISSGIYGYPREKAFQVAMNRIAAFLEKHDMMIYLSVFDSRSARPEPIIYGDLLNFIAQKGRGEMTQSAEPLEAELPDWDDISFEEITAPVEPDQPAEKPFIELLGEFRAAKGLPEKELCRRADMDKAMLAGIFNHPQDMPSQGAVWALCVGLGLDWEESVRLLKSAGRFADPSDKRDLIVSYFIIHKAGGIAAVNSALFAFDQPQIP